MKPVPTPAPPKEQVTLDFVLGRVWPRDGLSHCQRLLVTLACTCDAAAPGAVDAHMDGAPAGGDLTPYELAELVGRIAASCGWPSTSQAEGSVRAQLVRLSEERGGRVGPMPELSIESLGPGDLAVLLAGGERCLEDVNSGAAPSRDYRTAGLGPSTSCPVTSGSGRASVVSSVGWHEPVRGPVGAVMPIRSHDGSASRSGDVSPARVDEIVLQLSADNGRAEGALLHQFAAQGCC